MNKNNELKKLKTCLSKGSGFEDTNRGLELGFNNDIIMLYAENKKNNYSYNLDKFRKKIEDEEALHYLIKENENYYKKELIEFIKSNGGVIPEGKIKISEIEKALSVFEEKEMNSEHKDKKNYEQVYLHVKTILNVMRKNDFDIVKRFSSNIDDLIGNNLAAKEFMTDSLRYSIEKSNLNLVDALSIEPAVFNDNDNYYSGDDFLTFEERDSSRLEIEEKLDAHFKIGIGKELLAYIDNFNFKERGLKSDLFHEMMVSIEIKKIQSKKNKKSEMFWNSAEDFINSSIGELIVNESEKEDEDYCKTEKSFIVRQINEDFYKLKINSIEDCEGLNYKEEWFKNEDLHREGVLPALIERKHHYIPDETYLDNAYNQHWIEGEQISQVDRTYEDILSKKTLAERQSIGCDLDDDLSYEDDLPRSMKETIKKEVKDYKQKLEDKKAYQHEERFDY